MHNRVKYRVGRVSPMRSTTASLACRISRREESDKVLERFTDQARRVVVLAQEEAGMLNHGYIGTEHILLGLIREGEGPAARALERLGIRLEAVRQQVEEVIGRGVQEPSGHIPFTPRAEQVLVLSLGEASQLGHGYAGTEHILLSMTREGDCVAAHVLVRLGADLNRVRQQVITLLDGYEPREPAQPSYPTGSPPSSQAGKPGQGTNPRLVSRSARLSAGTGRPVRVSRPSPSPRAR
jgi:ATP-dependent Clp protease ATP-binding subunit ClpC